MTKRGTSMSSVEEEFAEIVGKPVKRRNTRAAKVAEGRGREVHEKFLPTDGVPALSVKVSITPRGDNQKKLLAYLREGRQLVWACGVAGTGKSMIAAYYASELLRNKKIEKIFLVRPNVHCGKSIGMLKGGMQDKLAPLLAQTLTHLEKFLGKSYTTYCLEKGVIEMCAVEYMRGTSFENCLVICEESQGLTEDEYEMMMTRVGENAQICFTGDQRQVDIKETTGLAKTLAMIDKVKKERPDYLDTQDMNEFLTNIGVVQFEFEDVQRSKMVKALTKLYFYKGAK